MSSLQTQASLVVAAFDLKAVELIRDAIRTADLSQAGSNTSNSSSATFQNATQIQPTPVYEPRQHFHPTPVYEPRPIIHQRPRIAATDQNHCQPCTPAPVKPQNSIQPPWKILPWQNTCAPRQTVKIHLIHTDVMTKGTVLDLFV